MSPACSHADCGKPAVLSWTRSASESETKQYADRLHGQRQAATDYLRTRALAYVVEFERTRDVIKSDPRVTPEQAARLEKLIASAQAEHDAITDPEPIKPGSSVHAVYGCEDHAPDAERAAKVHDTDCTDAQTCDCSGD